MRHLEAFITASCDFDTQAAILQVGGRVLGYLYRELPTQNHTELAVVDLDGFAEFSERMQLA
jgi:hypothetical protein